MVSLNERLANALKNAEYRRGEPNYRRMIREIKASFAAVDDEDIIVNRYHRYMIVNLYGLRLWIEECNWYMNPDQATKYVKELIMRELEIVAPDFQLDSFIDDSDGIALVEKCPAVDMTFEEPYQEQEEYEDEK